MPWEWYPNKRPGMRPAPEEEPSTYEKMGGGRGVAAAGIRGLSGLLAGVANPVLGIGTAFGATTAGLGETVAQIVEGSDPNVKRVLLEAGIGAVPGSAMFKMGKVAQTALRSGAMSGASTAARQFEEGGFENLDKGSIAMNTAIGAGVGGGLAKLIGVRGPLDEKKVHDLARKHLNKNEHGLPPVQKYGPPAARNGKTITATMEQSNRAGINKGIPPVDPKKDEAVEDILLKELDSPYYRQGNKYAEEAREGLDKSAIEAGLTGQRIRSQVLDDLIAEERAYNKSADAELAQLLKVEKAHEAANQLRAREARDAARAFGTAEKMAQEEAKLTRILEERAGMQEQPPTFSETLSAATPEGGRASKSVRWKMPDEEGDEGGSAFEQLNRLFQGAAKKTPQVPGARAPRPPMGSDEATAALPQGGGGEFLQRSGILDEGPTREIFEAWVAVGKKPLQALELTEKGKIPPGFVLNKDAVRDFALRNRTSKPGQITEFEEIPQTPVAPQAAEMADPANLQRLGRGESQELFPENLEFLGREGGHGLGLADGAKSGTRKLYRVEPNDLGDQGNWLQKSLTPAQWEKFAAERGRLFSDDLDSLKNYGHGEPTHTTYEVDVPEDIATKIARQHPDGFTEYVVPDEILNTKRVFGEAPDPSNLLRGGLDDLGDRPFGGAYVVPDGPGTPAPLYKGRVDAAGQHYDQLKGLFGPRHKGMDPVQKDALGVAGSALQGEAKLAGLPIGKAAQTPARSAAETVPKVPGDTSETRYKELLQKLGGGKSIPAEEALATLEGKGPAITPENTPDWVAEQLGMIDQLRKAQGGGDESGAIDPEMLASLLLGGVGGAVGAATDPFDNPLLSGLAGAGVGAAIPSTPQILSALGMGPEKVSQISEMVRTPEGLKKAAQDVMKFLPQYQRFSYLADWYGLPANAIVGPWGSAVTGAIEAGLSGDPRGWALLKTLRPQEFLLKMKNARMEAQRLLREGDIGRAEGYMDQPSWYTPVTSLPGEVMTQGDVAAREMIEAAGFSADEARRMTMTAEPETTFFHRLANLTKPKVGEEPSLPSMLGQMALPFARTPANVAESGLSRTPGIGFMMGNAIERGQGGVDPIRQQLVQQGLGLGMGAVGYGAGSVMDPESAKTYRRYLTNAAGRYSLPTAIGFAAGQAKQRGESPISFGALRGVDQALPLPTAEPVVDLVQFATKAAGDEPLSLNDYPRGAVPPALTQLLEFLGLKNPTVANAGPAIPPIPPRYRR